MAGSAPTFITGWQCFSSARPSLAEHGEDLPLLIEHFMQKLGRETPMKRIDADAMAKLAAHDWPGNVRELEHVLERAVILAGDEPGADRAGDRLWPDGELSSDGRLRRSG